MDNDSFVLLVVIIHQIDKGLDLRFGWNSIVRNVDVIVGKLTRHILAIIELAAIDDSPDIFLFVDFKHIRIGHHDAAMTPSTIQVKGSVRSGCPFSGQYQGRMGLGIISRDQESSQTFQSVVLVERAAILLARPSSRP